MRHARFLFMMAMLVLFVSGCAASRPLAVHSQTGSAAKTLGEGRIPVAGYVTRDGSHVTFWGYVEARGETLRFVRPKIKSRGLQLDKPEVIRDVPRDSVEMVQQAYTSVGRSILLGVGIGLSTLLMFGLSLANSYSICGARS